MPPGSAHSMPVAGHLEELRKRLIRSFLVLFVAATIAFAFSETIVEWLTRPIDITLVFLAPAEALWANIKVSLFVGFAVALPMILHEIWQFISPGLLPGERHKFLPFLFLATVSFFVGMIFCYFIALPFALRFLIDYGRQHHLIPQISLSMYMDFNLQFLLAFGLIFELPVVMVLLSKLGVLTPQLLSRHRKYAFFASFLIAAILTPTPDMFNQCIMAIPLVLLYEVGILAVRLFGQNKPASVDAVEGSQ